MIGVEQFEKTDVASSVESSSQGWSQETLVKLQPLNEGKRYDDDRERRRQSLHAPPEGFTPGARRLTVLPTKACMLSPADI